MTGTLQFKRLVTISSIEVEMPPGVFMTTSRADALSDSARLTAFWMYADMTLLMSPFRSACSTRGVAAMAAAGARTTAAAKSSHANRSATRARMLRVWQGAGPTADVKRGTSAARGPVQAARRIGRDVGGTSTDWRRSRDARAAPPGADDPAAGQRGGGAPARAVGAR